MRFTSCSLVVAASLMLELPIARATPGPLPTLAPVARYNGVEMERHQFRRGNSVVPVSSSSSAAAPLKTNGGSCSTASQCTSGYYKSGVCTEPTLPSKGCTSANQCSTGACNQGACVSKPGKAKVGSYCNNSTQCLTTAYCGTASNTCTAKKAAGSTCLLGTSCTSGLCLGVCIDPGTVKSHAKCFTDSMCKSGLFCSASSDICTTQYALGKTCTRSSMCSSENCAYPSKSKTKVRAKKTTKLKLASLISGII